MAGPTSPDGSSYADPPVSPAARDPGSPGRSRGLPSCGRSSQPPSAPGTVTVPPVLHGPVTGPSGISTRRAGSSQSRNRRIRLFLICMTSRYRRYAYGPGRRDSNPQSPSSRRVTFPPWQSNRTPSRERGARPIAATARPGNQRNTPAAPDPGSPGRSRDRHGLLLDLRLAHRRDDPARRPRPGHQDVPVVPRQLAASRPRPRRPRIPQTAAADSTRTDAMNSLCICDVYGGCPQACDRCPVCGGDDETAKPQP
jgi:hypothetical protein